MTCIVGLIDSGKIWMGGDAAGTSSTFSQTIRKDKKIFVNGEMLFGFTSSYRMGNLLAYKLRVPKRGPAEDIFAWMVTDLVEAIRTCLKEGGFAKKELEQETGGAFLVGVAGKLFTIWDDYQVSEAVDPWASVGSGSDVAVGAMYATSSRLSGIVDSPQDRILTALRAAEANNAAVRGPFTLMSI